MITLALLALPLAQTDCGAVWQRRFEAHGTIQVVQAPLPPPLAGSATGDPVTLVLEFTDDPECTTPAGLPGPPAQLACKRLIHPNGSSGTLGNVLFCPWGEVRSGTDVTGVDLDVSFGGTLFVGMRLRDPNLTVGIGSVRAAGLPGYPIDVASVGDPGFSATIELRDSSGGLRGLVDLSLITFEDPFRSIGTTHCLSNVNYNNTVGFTRAFGSPLVVDDRFALSAEDVTRNAFGFFFCSRTPDVVPGAGGSSGVLCLGGSIGRFVRQGEIQFSGSSTRVSIRPSLNDFPQPTSTVAVQPGETWYFQYWFREPGVSGQPASNMASGCMVTFQ